MKPLVFYILDIIMKFIREGKTHISIIINESTSKDFLSITVTENDSLPVGNEGCRKIDLPLLEYQTKVTGGYLENGTGTGKPASMTAKFCLSHPERQRLGDIAGVLAVIIAAHPEMEFTYNHNTDSGNFHFSTSDARKFYKVRILKDAGLLKSICLSINEQLKEIGAADMRA